MKLSTRTRYGTRALLELALRKGEGPIFLKDIAKQQEISLPYLEHLIAPLIAGGVIRSTKGPKGGISLARNPEEIKLSEITQLLEGTVAPVECIDDPGACSRSSSCVTRDVWKEVSDAINGILTSITLEDMVNRRREKEGSFPPMYEI